jgi:hypothetical protein
VIRFIIKRREDNGYGARTTNFETFDAPCPALEHALTGGGQAKGGPGYDLRELVGVEVLPNTPGGEHAQG